MTSPLPPPPSAHALGDSRRRRGPRILGIALALLAVCAVAFSAYRLGAAQEGRPVLADLGGTGALSDDLAPVEDLYARLLSEAVRAPDRDTLIDGALEGMLDTLDDPYATYYDPAAFADVSDFIEGGFSGVGLYLEESPRGFEIVNVIEGSPAEEAGVQAGERIIAVDGADVTGLPIDSLVQRVRGEEGTTVTLRLLTADEQEREVEVTRQRIDLPLVEAEMVEEDTGHLRLLRFTRDAADEARAEIERLEDEGAQGFVVDLRGNPGGLLTEAVAVTSLFVEEGPAALVKEREGEREAFDVSGDTATDLPLVVLVDGGSASASEIVAGAIQDAGRGVIVGTPTFGKGTVQTIRTLQGERGAKFTTAEYFTRSGDSIEEVGVTPDREVAEDADPDDLLAVAVEALRELVAEAAPLGAGS